MQQAYVQVVSVVLGLCKLYIILYRMVKAAQLRLGGFFVCKKLRIGLDILKVIQKTIVGSIEVYGMKTDAIKEALESVKKEDPKLYEDVVEYISSNRNKTGVHPEGVYQEHSWPNIIGPMPGPFPHPRNPFEQNPFGVFWPLAGLYLFYKLVRRVWRLLRGKNQNISLDDIITYMNNHK